jgi:hypothetical protein
LQGLANSLLEQLADKEDALRQQRATKEALARRIMELEGLLEAARSGGVAGGLAPSRPV